MCIIVLLLASAFASAFTTASAAARTAAAASGDEPRFFFEEVGAARGILDSRTQPGMSFGVAAADFDDDGDIDLFLPTWGASPDHLYVNVGGRFEERAVALGIGSSDGNRCALWLDYDGDRDLDLFVANDDDFADTSFLLFRQDPGPVFTDVTVAAGLDLSLDAIHRGGIAAADFDQDGFLDLYVATWNGDSFLFFNQGDGSFIDASVSSGIRDQAGPLQWQPMAHDFDGDGLLDLMIAVDVTENHLWMNQGNRSFVDIAAAAGVNNQMNDMGLALGDYDLDGDLDAFMTNIYAFTGTEHNVFYRNETVGGVPGFAEVSEALGVDDSAWAWGTGFWDLDNDGDLDLAATNGFHGEPWSDDETRLWLNRGVGPDWFTGDQAPAVGLNDDAWGSALVALDFDRDGDLDLALATKKRGLFLLENHRRPVGWESSPASALCIAPRMRGKNYRAIGATVHADVGGQTLIQLIHAGTSLQGQEPAEAHFGLGSYAQADAVTVRFPGGAVSTVESVPAGAWPFEIAPPPFTDHRITEGVHRRGRFVSLWDSDDQRLIVASSAGNAGAATTLQTGWTLPGAPTSIDIDIESAANISGCTQTAELYDWVQQQWTPVASWNVDTQDSVHSILGLPVADTLRADGRVRLRLRIRVPNKGESASRQRLRARWDMVSVEG